MTTETTADVTSQTEGQASNSWLIGLLIGFGVLIILGLIAAFLCWWVYNDLSINRLSIFYVYEFDIGV